MAFNDVFNEYLKKLCCSNVELAKLSHLDPSVISRYKSGKRVPSSDSPVVKSLATAMLDTAYMKGISDFPFNIYEILVESINDEEVREDTEASNFQANFSNIMDRLGVTNATLARYMKVDASYISRIRNNQRKPADINEFSLQFANFLAKNYFTQNKNFFASLLKVSETDLTEMRFVTRLTTYMCGETVETNKAFENFLFHLDGFDLNDYIDTIHFNDIKVPMSPILLPGSKKYVGIEEMRTGTIDFLKNTVLSKSTDDVTIYSDMPVEELAKDKDFSKKWMMGLALMIKKGLHLNCIHCVSRSFDDLMLGLESWIPLYMTGQISPYYFKETVNTVFQHLIYTSGSVALRGECIAGHQDEGMYFLTKNHAEVDYYNKTISRMIEKAEPLMNIYRLENRMDYLSFRQKEATIRGERRVFLSAPSIYTMPEKLLLKILNRNSVPDERIADILRQVANYKNMIKQTLLGSVIHEIVPRLTKEKFNEDPLLIQLSDAFIDLNVNYTYEEYKEHLDSLADFEAENKKYSYEFASTRWFKNIQIVIHDGECVIVSKGNSPIISFVIHQPDLRFAFENMVLPEDF